MGDRIVILLSPALVAYAYPGSHCPMVHRAESMRLHGDTAQAAVNYILPQVTVRREVVVTAGITLLDVVYGKASGTVIVIASDEVTMPLDKGAE